jgi:hypothetical protein
MTTESMIYMDPKWHNNHIPEHYTDESLAGIFVLFVHILSKLPLKCIYIVFN